MTAQCEPVTKCHALRMATICSGIGAPEVASIGLDFDHIFMSEIEPFPSAVLAHHWPYVPNLGDMTKIDGEAYQGKVDVLVGGTIGLPMGEGWRSPFQYDEGEVKE